MAMLAFVDPATPRCAIQATAKEKMTATNIMKRGPGLLALMKPGQSVPTR